MHNIEWFDRYLKDELTSAEKEEFEKRLFTDADFRKAFEEHKLLVSTLRQLENERKFEEWLHKKETKYHARSNRNPDLYSSDFKWRIFFQAAAVALIVSLITVFVWYKLTFKNPIPAQEITNLKLQIHGLQYSQRAIQNKMLEKKSGNSADVLQYQGTGFMFHPDGYILTSYHVVQNSDSVMVSSPEISGLKAEVIARDSLLDIAVLKINNSNFTTPSGAPFSFYAFVADLGEKVATLGYPGTYPVYGEGVLSSLYGFEGDTTQYMISVPLNPGNSGAPLWDQSGRLIGLIRGKNISREGNAFAVKSSLIIRFLKKENIPFRTVSSKKQNSIQQKQFLKMVSPFVFRVHSFE
jgi:S1-C subfamily serine protease